MNSTKTLALLPALQQYVDTLPKHYSSISTERKQLLEEIAEFLAPKVNTSEPIPLVFICTHNSRRSHLGQLWAAAIATSMGWENISSWSGGTEATACNPRTVTALRKAGFDIENPTPEAENPHYQVSYAPDRQPDEVFSKAYHHEFNPQQGFVAFMTCAEADAGCPVVFGAAKRFPLRYEDPKAFDDTPKEAAAYEERCLQIATEIHYCFSRVSTNQ